MKRDKFKDLRHADSIIREFMRAHPSGSCGARMNRNGTITIMHLRKRYTISGGDVVPLLAERNRIMSEKRE